jgi:ABC-type transporter Mla MlaB component
MAKEEPNGGLLSKVVKFVRNPTTNWADLDNKESDRESSYTKQALKEMIERKRRNDFVRKREFDMLRKLRRREAMSGQDAGARPSFFQSSLPSKPDDRAMTLKKIDEIEAQMSMQWWKTKHGANSSLPQSGGSSSFPNSDMPSSTPPTGQPARAAAPKGASYERTMPASLEQMQEVRAPSVKLTPPPSPAGSAAPRPPTRNAPSPAIGGLAASYDGAVTGFTASKLNALEVGDVQHDPEMEEAAIRFANGDDTGAEAGLMEAISARGTRSGHEETWFTLFDLYRATGQHDRFESLAIDFANRFNRSGPSWFSIPELVSRMSGSNAVSVPAVGGVADWRCPQQLGVQTLAALNASLSKAPMPWRLDWTKLRSIEPPAIVPLARLFSAWAAQPVQLRFLGCEQLDSVLKSMTPSGKPDAPQDGWHLRMQTLRIMHRPDEFELTALDFCVTYEVSPPAWEGARCEFKSLDGEGTSKAGHTIIGDAALDSIPSSINSGGIGDTLFGSGQNAQLATVELAGQIMGDATSALEKLEARLMGADVMVISCAKLIRVDFSAAGTLLNWVSARQAEGRTVHFSEAHRLVSAFFYVIGISEYAKVSARVD